MQKKKLEVGDWVRVRRNLVICDIGIKYLGKVYKIGKKNLAGYYLIGVPEGWWEKTSLIPVGNLSRLIEIRKESYEIQSREHGNC